MGQKLWSLHVESEHMTFKERLLLVPNNGPYLKRDGDCVIAVGFTAPDTAA